MDLRMRVLYIVTAYKRDEKDIITPWMTETILQLKKRGVDVEVFAPSYKGMGDHLVDGVTVRRFRYFLSRWENLTHEQTAPDRLETRLSSRLLVPFYLIGGVIGMIRLMRVEKYDVLQAHWPLPSFLFAYTGKLLTGTRIVSSFYGVEIRWIKSNFPFLKFFLKWVIDKSDVVTAITPSTAAEIRSIRDTDIEVIPYSLGLKGESAPESPGQFDSDSVGAVLFVGRLVERKGVDYLLRAIQSVREKHDVRTVIVGEGSEKEKLMKLAVELGIESSVTFTGTIDEDQLARYYQACSMLVLPAVFDQKGDTEGQGVVIIEAWSFKKPVVASGIGGIRDVVRDGKTGILVREKNVGDLSRAISRLIENRELALELGKKGYESYRSTYHWNAIVEKWMGVYLAGEPPGT